MRNRILDRDALTYITHCSNVLLYIFIYIPMSTSIDIDPAKLTGPNLLKSLSSADKLLENLSGNLEGILTKVHNSKSLTEEEEEKVIERLDRIDANMARISSFRAAIYGTLLGRFRMDMNARPMLSRTASARQSKSKRSKSKTRRARSM